MKYRGHNPRRDGNERDIIDALRKIGCHTEPLSGCPGMPDLLVSLGRRIFLLEIKNPAANGKVNEYQIDFQKRFPVVVVRSIEEALEAVTL